MSDPAARPSPPTRTRRIIVSVAQLLLGVALVGLVLGWLSPSWSEVSARVTLHPRWLLLSVVGSALTTLFTAARWKLLSETMGAGRLPYGVYVHSLALVRLLAQVLPAALVDLLGRGVALRAAGSSDRMGDLLTPLVLERLLDLLLPLAMLGWAVVVVLPASPPVDPWVSLGALVVLFGLGAIPMLGPLVRVALRALRWLRSLRRRGEPLPPAPAPRVPLALAAWVVALGLARYASMLLQFWAAGAGLGVALDPLVLVAATPVAQLAVIIGITPGGLGLAEGGWAAALSRLGVGEAATVVFMAATRLMMGVSFAVLTLASWPWRRAPGREPDAPGREPDAR